MFQLENKVFNKVLFCIISDKNKSLWSNVGYIIKLEKIMGNSADIYKLDQIEELLSTEQSYLNPLIIYNLFWTDMNNRSRKLKTSNCP